MIQMDRFFFSIPSDSLRILSIMALTLVSSCRVLSFNTAAMVSSMPRRVMIVMGCLFAYLSASKTLLIYLK